MTDAATAPAAAGGAASDLLNGNAAPPAAPSWQPTGMPIAPAAFDAPEAVAARAEIEAGKSDLEFGKSLTGKNGAEKQAAAKARWDLLHKTGYPTPTAIRSQDDVNAQASARTEEQWNSFFSGLRAQWQVTAEHEAEMRGGVIREEFHNWALQQRDLMVKDKAFYRRLVLDGDMAAKERWGRVVAMIGLRPVK